MTESNTLRSSLRARADVPDQDIEDVIAIALELQDADREAASGASLQDVQDVARELDIAPAYVEQALSTLAQRREDAQAATQRAAEEALAAQQRLKRRALTAAASVTGLLVCFGFWVSSAIPAARSSDAELANARAQLHAVIDRQAGLAPQLVSLAGGDGQDLTQQVDTIRDAEDLDAKLRASDALGQAMAQRIAQLKPTDASSQQLRLNLQYEITGSANRIATERGRYERARVAHELARRGLRASLAQSLGLID